MVRKRDIKHIGGEIFSYTDEPSDRSVLWGELFREKERKFLQASLATQLVCFSIRDTFQISVRTVWQPEPLFGRMTRKCRAVGLLHPWHGKTTTSWTWAKFFRPLFGSGFSVVAVEFPGFGSSSMNMATTKLSDWKSQDWHLLVQVLDEIKLTKCHFIACGESCSVLFRILQRSPSQLEQCHILHNPIINYDELFADSVGGPPPGAGADWREKLRAQQQAAMEDLCRSASLRLWVTWDGDEASRETVDSFRQCTKNEMLMTNITVTELTRDDICEAQVGARLPVWFLFPSKQLGKCYAQYLWQRAVRPPQYVPAAPGRPPAHPSTPERARSKPSSKATSKESFAAASGTTALALASTGLDRSASQPGLRRAGLDGAITAKLSAQECKSAFSIVAARQLAHEVLPTHPRASRARLLSALPASMQPLVLDQLRDPLNFEQGMSPDEKRMMDDAADASVMTYLNEVGLPMSKHGSRRQSLASLPDERHWQRK